jgi:hypothetical protein
MLPSHLFDGLVSTLHLQATRFRFESSVDLQVFPQASYQINQFGSTFMSANTISRIDSLGFINYEREHLQFEGMPSQQLHAIYGRFDLSAIRIRFLSPIAKEIKFQDARLLIADHPDLEGLPLFQSTYRQLILQTQFSYNSEQFSDASNAVEPSGDAILGIVPAYYVIDFSGRYQFKKNFSVELGITNLTNNQYFTRRATGYPGPGILPSDGVSFYTTIQYQFKLKNRH